MVLVFAKFLNVLGIKKEFILRTGVYKVTLVTINYWHRQQHCQDERMSVMASP